MRRLDKIALLPGYSGRIGVRKAKNHYEYVDNSDCNSILHLHPQGSDINKTDQIGEDADVLLDDEIVQQDLEGMESFMEQIVD